MFIAKKVGKNVFSFKRNKIRKIALWLNYFDDFFNFIFKISFFVKFIFQKLFNVNYFTPLFLEKIIFSFFLFLDFINFYLIKSKTAFPKNIFLIRIKI